MSEQDLIRLVFAEEMTNRLVALREGRTPQPLSDTSVAYGQQSIVPAPPATHSTFAPCSQPTVVCSRSGGWVPLLLRVGPSRSTATAAPVAFKGGARAPAATTTVLAAAPVGGKGTPPPDVAAVMILIERIARIHTTVASVVNLTTSNTAGVGCI